MRLLYFLKKLNCAISSELKSHAQICCNLNEEIKIDANKAKKEKTMGLSLV